MNKTNRRTEFLFYWYYESTCFGQPFCPSSGVLSRTSALVYFMQIWLPFATRSRMEHPAPGSKRSSNLHKIYQCRCTAKNSWWWAERLPETCRVVIPIKLQFSTSVGFIHKECVTTHGHTIFKKKHICLFTAIGLTPGGSSTVHIYTQTIHRTTPLNWEECGPCPVFASYALAFALQLGKKDGKTSVRVAEECQLARWKQNIQNST